MHDFMPNVAFDDAFNVAKEKYARRIERFLNLLRSKKNVLLVYMSSEKGGTDAKAVIETASGVLNDADLCCESKGVDFLIIHLDENAPETVSDLTDRIAFATAPSKDAAEKIFAKLKLHRSVGERIKTIGKDIFVRFFLLRVLPAFICSSKKRREFRDSLKIRYKY